MSPVQACRNLYALNPFVESLTVGRYLRDHSTENARIAVIGSEPEIYFYAHRRSATGYIYTYALMESQPYALKMQQEMIREIETVRPEYLVYVSSMLSWLIQTNSDQMIFHWFDGYAARCYRKVDAVNLDFTGKAEGLRDESTRPGPTGEYIAVYQRRSDLKPTPSPR